MPSRAHSGSAEQARRRSSDVPIRTAREGVSNVQPTTAFVRTVSGDCEPGELGRTSMHEHVFIDASVWLEDPAQTPTVIAPDPGAAVNQEILHVLHRNPVLLHDNLIIDDEVLAIAEVSDFYRSGGGCIVDATTIGLGRRPLSLQRVADRTGVRIVAGTGFYTERSHPRIVQTASVEELADIMIRDIREGIDGTAVKAGIIGEIGTSTLTPAEAKVLRACALAHEVTGAAISLHTEMRCREAENIIALLNAEGVRSDRIIAGHMDENLTELAPGLAHLDYHLRVAETGAWVQYDTFGSEGYIDSMKWCEPRDTDRVAGIVALVEAGYTDQLLLGQDVWLKSRLKRYGGSGYDHLLRVVPVMLRWAGLSDEVIDRLLIENPSRALSMHDG